MTLIVFIIQEVFGFVYLFCFFKERKVGWNVILVYGTLRKIIQEFKYAVIKIFTNCNHPMITNMPEIHLKYMNRFVCSGVTGHTHMSLCVNTRYVSRSRDFISIYYNVHAYMCVSVMSFLCMCRCESTCV